VAHGITTYAETDNYGDMRKVSATEGGLLVAGYSEVSKGLALTSWYTSDNTAKSGTAVAAVVIETYKKSGTSITSPGADANLLTICNGSGPVFIFDAEGSAHADIEWITFDDQDDIALLTSLERHLADPLRADFGDFMMQHRATLERLKLVTFNPDGHHFLNTTRLAMLLTGAVRQLAGRLERLERLVLGGKNESVPDLE
jgi:hypothetical protein